MYGCNNIFLVYTCMTSIKFSLTIEGNGHSTQRYHVIHRYAPKFKLIGTSEQEIELCSVDGVFLCVQVESRNIKDVLPDS